jgi:hypothetical protein
VSLSYWRSLRLCPNARSGQSFFRNQPVDHYTGWKVFQRTMPELRGVPYEAYLRGRVTFVNEAGGIFNLMVDPLIMAQPVLMAKLYAIFNLPGGTTRPMLDPHYRSPQP